MDTWFPTFRRIAGLDPSGQPIGLVWPWLTTNAQRKSLLRLLATATEEHLPLAPLLEGWANDERGVQRARVRRLAALLAEGVPLADAVEQEPSALREQDVLAIRFGAESGTLASTLRDALADAETSSNSARLFRKTMIYLFTVIAVAICVVAFMFIKVVPSLQAIYEDFDMQLPSEMIWSIDLIMMLERYWFLFVLALAALAWTAFTVSGNRFLRGANFFRLIGGMRELRAADILQKLSVASRAGRPVAGALSTLARYHFEPDMRHKLLFIRNEVEQGADVWQSMATAGLLTPPERELMRTSERVGNRSWALRQLAAGKTRRVDRRLHKVAQLALPIVVLLIGAFVLLQSVAMFASLTNLISSLAG